MDCGTSDHPSDCLCDVIVTNPTPIRFSPTDLPYADMLMRLRNYGTPWDANKILDLMTDLLEARDLTEQVRNLGETKWTDTKLAKHTEKRIKEGDSILDVALAIDEPVVRIAMALSNNNPQITWTWSPERWAEVEDMFRSGEVLPRRATARKLGMAVKAVERLARMYGTELADKPRNADHALVTARFEADPEVPTAELIAWLREEHDIVVDSERICLLRSRFRAARKAAASVAVGE